MEITLLTLPPIIIALSEVLKRALALSDAATERFIPLFNLALGILLGVVFLNLPELKFEVLFGILAGLSAGGLYDLAPVQGFTKAVADKVEKVAGQ